MKTILLYFLVIFPVIASAQPRLTLTGAIDTALKNNFDIQIARNITEINKTTNSYGFAGGLPSVNATATNNNTLYNLNQKLNNGTVIVKDKVPSYSINSGVTASMVLFNGFKIIATKERLNILQTQSELQLNQQIQNTIAAIMVTYFDILRQLSYLNIIQSNMQISAKKSEIIKVRYCGLLSRKLIIESLLIF